MQLQLRENKWTALSQASVLQGKSKELAASAKKLQLYRTETPQVMMKSVMVIISDDSGFASLLKRARGKGWMTGIVCRRRHLYKFEDIADVWLSWEDDYDDELADMSDVFG